MSVLPSQASLQDERSAPHSQLLAEFLAGLRFEQLPAAVVARVDEAFVDWFSCALAGRGARPVQILEQFATLMGPETGPSQVLVSRRSTSPFFAALVNGAASHIVELDDLHNGSILHPGTVVFPALFAAAQHSGSSGREFLTAAVAGYEAVIRIGEFLGPAHYKMFHTTGTAGTLGAAAGVARLLRLNTRTMQHALGSAGTQAAGLWEFLRDSADSKPLHTGKAAADGLLSAYIAREGFTGARQILEGDHGLGKGTSQGADPAKLSDGLGKRWGVLESSFKLHSCCGHIHPSADAFLGLIQKHGLKADNIVRVVSHVHRAAINVLGGITNPDTVHQAKFSMNFVLALIAVHGRAGLTEFTDASLRDPHVREFQGRVEMVFDEEIDRAPGNCWGGWVEVKTRDGRHLQNRIAAPKGHPQNTLNRTELGAKAMMLAAHASGASPEEMRQIIAHAWNLPNEANLKNFFLAS